GLVLKAEGPLTVVQDGALNSVIARPMLPCEPGKRANDLVRTDLLAPVSRRKCPQQSDPVTAAINGRCIDPDSRRNRPACFLHGNDPTLFSPVTRSAADVDTDRVLTKEPLAGVRAALRSRQRVAR